MNLNFSCYIEYRFYLVSERFITLTPQVPTMVKHGNKHIPRNIISS